MFIYAGVLYSELLAHAVGIIAQIVHVSAVDRQLEKRVGCITFLKLGVTLARGHSRER
jgi:hypothetical protein